jgi:hypothetical protein
VAIRRINRTDTNKVVQYYGPFWKLLQPGEAKIILHTAFREAGTLWLVTYIPRRFSNYAYSLGYRVTEQWKKFKRRMLRGTGAAIPYIGLTPPGGGTNIVKKGRQIFKGNSRNAEKMAVAIERGARVNIKGTSTGADIHIPIPYGHPIQAMHSAALRKLPAHETQAVVDEAARQLAHFMQFAQPVPGSRKKKLTIRGATQGVRPRSTGLAGGPRK